VLDPAAAGAVLPIVHLNGFRMGAPSLLGHLPEEELRALFRGHGYEPLTVGPSHAQLARALGVAHERLDALAVAGAPRGPRPLIVMRTPKGWSGPVRWRGTPVEGGSISHKSPFRAPADDSAERLALGRWLRSYRPGELFDERGVPRPEVTRCLPEPRLRLGAATVPASAARPLALPPLSGALPGARPLPGAGPSAAGAASSAEAIGEYLARVIEGDRARAFRVFSPDELRSNRLTAILRATPLAAPAPHAAGELPAAPSGRVMEVLSEHLCVGWLQGHLQGGGHGIFASYEAFAPIVASMLAQHLKFLADARPLPWRAPRASLTMLLTSLCWDNCYTHQNPGLLDSLLCGGAPFVRVYTPSDALAALAALRASLASRDRLNAIVASKVALPVRRAPASGAPVLADGCRVAGESAAAGEGAAVDAVLAAAGDRLYAEAAHALEILRARTPALNVRLVAIEELTALGSRERFEAALSDAALARSLTAAAPVQVAFTGHPGALKQLLFDRPRPERFDVAGFARASGRGTSLAARVVELALAREPRLRRRPALCGQAQRLLEWVAARHAETGARPGAGAEPGRGGGAGDARPARRERLTPAAPPPSPAPPAPRPGSDRCRGSFR
jgi:xylulose-5-phosphate/fructose-6-phosphate phosphoketolase